VDFLAGKGRGEPSGAVDFGDFDPAAGAAGELDAGGVTDDVARVGIGFAGPAVNQLAGFLLHRAERKEGAADDDASFSGQLAASGSERLFAGADEALGNRPGPGIAVFPEGTAGMHEEHFQLAVRAAKEQ